MTELNENNSSTFAELFEKLDSEKQFNNVIKKGKIISIDGDYVTVDVGLKSEGRIAKSELLLAGNKDLKVGDDIEVYIDQYEDRDGSIVLSREKAVKETSWEQLEELQKRGEVIEGTILKQVKSGFIVDIGNASAFLPGSQVELHSVTEAEAAQLIGTTHKFLILKMDRIRGNIVISRRAILEAAGAEEKAKALENLEEGQVIDGTVKNITSYGAFVDIGGVDGLVHNTDLSWKRIAHASDLLQPGQKIKVKVIKFNKENSRISLGIKQLEEDPWKTISAEFPVNSVIKGKVTHVTEYGIFVEVKPGVEGLVYVSEVSWKKNISPQKLISTGDEIDVKVLDIDLEKRRMGLSLKRLQDNPFIAIAKEHPVGSTFEGTITKATDFGIFVCVANDIDGLVHVNDLVWAGNPDAELAKYKKGDVVTVKVLDIDEEKERISLGIKQLTENPYKGVDVKVARGTVVTCIINAVQQDGLSVTLPNGVPGFIKKTDLAKDRQDRNVDRFATGEKVDAKIISVENGGKKVNLSIKALEIDEEKQYLAEYGSSDSGASLGDILGSSIELGKKK